MRTIARDELVNMHPDVLAQLAEQLRDALSATGRKDVFTKQEAADYTCHSVRKLERLIARGDLATTRLGDSAKVLVTRAALDELLARGEQ